MSTSAPTPPEDAFPAGQTGDMRNVLLSPPTGAKPASTPAGRWEPPSAEELQKLLPQYEISALLGRGGMGAVYKGTQIALDRPVAIKILSNQLEEADASFAERFKNEARAMAKLTHPGIVGVYDFGETASGLLYIVMEFIEGTDVAKMISKQGRLHTEHAMAITAHVCDALAYAHERGIIHRDIKPANIMVGYDGVVKVADFGLAKFSATAGETLGLTQSGMAMGTLHFMAPEALMLGSAVDLRADIYAVGVMLYQMLTGKLPHGMFELPSIQVKGLDPRYDGIIAKAMREDRALRYQSAREMRHDLDGILTQPVQQVEMEATRPLATLPTEARPRRSPAGQPYRPPQRSAPPPVKKKSSAGLVLLTLGWLGAIGAALFFLGQDRKVPAGVKASANVERPAATAATTTELASATKEAPYVNTLGMKFVPVSITGGPTDNQRVLFSVWETRVQDYEAFVKEAGRKAPQPRFQSNFAPGPLDPVTAVNWDEATAFCVWLTERERKADKIAAADVYRLPSDHEWSCAVGIGNREDPSMPPAKKSRQILDAFPWGTAWPPPEGMENLAGEELKPLLDGGLHPYIKQVIPGYRDDFTELAPVGSFKPNALGLHDLGGNVVEWCEDWMDANRKFRVLRGATWLNHERAYAGASVRTSNHPTESRFNNYGFRVVLAPAAYASTAASTPASSSPSSAAKEAPFVNTLGMKFLPVPGTKVLFSIWETRVRDYSTFARSNKVDDSWTNRQRNGSPVARDPDHPVVAVNWEEAQAFCRWLTDEETKAGKLTKGWLYRLPKDEEWSLAVGLPPEQGQTPAHKSRMNRDLFPWGSSFPPTDAKVGNYADTEWHEKFPTDSWLTGYTDGFATTSPVGSFPANLHGLHDLGGNVWEWCEDLLTGQGTKRVLRGGSWGNSSSDDLSSATRYFFSDPETHVHAYGFRCVLQTSP